jgi:hypothetical protein
MNHTKHNEQQKEEINSGGKPAEQCRTYQHIHRSEKNEGLRISGDPEPKLISV